MTLDPDTCYRAVSARDGRFDGVFFVAVSTTGIYCRPICPARTPGRARCSFFARAAEAERAGYRACFRCRPELAPGLAAIDSIPRLVRRAAARVEAGFLNEHSIEELATELEVTSRHLRRAMESELGVSPVELAQTRRLAMAKQLLHDTDLSLAEVAFASGFSSVRRFNGLFQARFGRAPSAIRREHGSAAASEGVALRLDYRAPLDWVGLLAFLRARAIPGIESVQGGEYRRSVVLGDCTGWVCVGPDPRRAALRARASISLAPKLPELVSRLRALFDLDARPDAIGSHLRRDASLRELVAARPGLRVPGAFDGFELAVRAVLGQQVSVAAATTLCGRLVARFGAIRAGAPEGPRAFPTAKSLAEAPLASVRAIGLPSTRARTLVDLSRAIDERRIDLSPAVEPERACAELQRIRGIGPWTASYLAMRALRWPDAFPAMDLGVRKALGVSTGAAAEVLAEPWRPWRAYAVMHLWSSRSHSQGG